MAILLSMLPILAQVPSPDANSERSSAVQIALIAIAALAAVTLLLVILRSQKKKPE